LSIIRERGNVGYGILGPYIAFCHFSFSGWKKAFLRSYVPLCVPWKGAEMTDSEVKTATPCYGSVAPFPGAREGNRLRKWEGICGLE
jgi:hypothetical protein